MKVTLITSNISADFLNPPGVPPWEERRLPYVHVLRHAAPDIICLQEVTPRQLAFLQEQLPEFTALTVPVENPAPDLLDVWRAKYAQAGFPEIPSPYELILFFRTEVFECLSTGYCWLSPTPEIPSIGFGNVAPRALLWAHLRHKASNHGFVIFNTHIDHRSTMPMIELCRRKFAEFEEKHPSLILAGDLNFNETDTNYGLLLSDGWKDTHSVSSGKPSDTFLYNKPGTPSGRIDHILYKSSELVPENWNRLLPPASSPRISDHHPVCVQFETDQV